MSSDYYTMAKGPAPGPRFPAPGRPRAPDEILVRFLSPRCLIHLYLKSWYMHPKVGNLPLYAKVVRTREETTSTIVRV